MLIELGAHVGEGAVELIVKTTVRGEDAQPLLRPLELLPIPLGDGTRCLRGFQLFLGAERRELGGSKVRRCLFVDRAQLGKGSLREA